MTTLIIILFYIVATVFVALTLMTIYEIFLSLYWRWQSKYNSSNTGYENNQAKKCSKLIVKNLIIMIIIALGIFAYYLPVKFHSIGLNGDFPKNIHNINVTTYKDEKSVYNHMEEKEEIQDIINIFQDYKYRKSIVESRIGNGFIFTSTKENYLIDMYISGEGSYICLSVSANGYVYNSHTGQAYKVIANNKEKLFNRLFEKVYKETNYYVIKYGEKSYYEKQDVFINRKLNFKEILDNTVKSLNEIKDGKRDLDFIKKIESEELANKSEHKIFTSMIPGESELKIVSAEIEKYEINGLIYDKDENTIKVFMSTETKEEDKSGLLKIINNQTYIYKVKNNKLILVDYSLSQYI